MSYSGILHKDRRSEMLKILLLCKMSETEYTSVKIYKNGSGALRLFSPTRSVIILWLDWLLQGLTLGRCVEVVPLGCVCIKTKALARERLRRTRSISRMTKSKLSEIRVTFRRIHSFAPPNRLASAWMMASRAVRTKKPDWWQKYQKQVYEHTCGIARLQSESVD